MDQISSPTDTAPYKSEYFDEKDSNDTENSVSMSEEYEERNSSVEAVRLGMCYVRSHKIIYMQREKIHSKSV